jgi:hypothetical protein
VQWQNLRVPNTDFRCIVTSRELKCEADFRTCGLRWSGSKYKKGSIGKFEFSLQFRLLLVPTLVADAKLELFRAIELGSTTFHHSVQNPSHLIKRCAQRLDAQLELRSHRLVVRVLPWIHVTLPSRLRPRERIGCAAGKQTPWTSKRLTTHPD